MNSDVKYYIVRLKDSLFSDLDEDVFFCICENGKYHELLTNKEIYMIDEKEFNKDDFLSSDCKLIGINKKEYSVDKIAIFLKFLPSDAKNELVKKINDIEKSLYNSLNNTKNKVKRLKKEDFLRNF